MIAGRWSICWPEQLVDRFGAPDVDDRAGGRGRGSCLCAIALHHPISSLIAVHRTVSDGEVRESFRRLAVARGAGHGKAFSFMEVEDDVEAGRRSRPCAI